MSTDGTQNITLRRERVNKHSVRYTARDCTESATAPCPSVTLPTALVDELGLGEADDLLVRVYATDHAATPTSETPIYEQLLAGAASELGQAIAADVKRQAAARERELQLAALTGVGLPPAPLDVPELVANEVPDCSCAVDGVTHEGHPQTGSGD